MKKSILFLVSLVPAIAFSQPFTMVKNTDGTLSNIQTLTGPLTKAGGIFYFTATSIGDWYCYRLYKTDGTANGTVMVKDVCAKNLTDVNGVLYFSNRGELWKSDGTTAGTVMVKSITPGEI